MSSIRQRRRVYLIPHTHFDAEVFISREETMRLGSSNLWRVMRMLADHPDLTFAIDQVCYLRPFLERFPEARDRLDGLMKAGRVELVGGMHGMPDVNIPSGESLIRQILHGLPFFETLGPRPSCAWTLDVFGHHPQVPQILAKSGYAWTASQRVRPAGSPAEFLYEGLDGTRLIFAWLPASYCVFAGVPSDYPTFKAFTDSRLGYLDSTCAGPELLAISGGDIDAPAPYISDFVRRYNEGQDTWEIIFATPAQYLEVLRARKGLPVVKDDMNPVFQGCYSARIAVKQHNRVAETALQGWETLGELAALTGAAAAPTVEVLQDAWEPVMFNQAHDIICGSHVDSTYQAALDRFAYSAARTKDGTAAVLAGLTGAMDTRGEGIPVAVLNTLGHERTECVECTVGFADPGAVALVVKRADGTVVPSDLLAVERFGDGSIRTATVLFQARAVPSCGYEVYHVVPRETEPATDATDLSSSERWNIRSDRAAGWMQNTEVRLGFDMWTGCITTLRHRPKDRELIPAERPWGNTVVRERDFGNFWEYNGPCKGDAFHPTPKRYPLPAQGTNAVEYSHEFLGDANIRTGRVFAEMTIGHPYGNGHFTTRVRVTAGSPRIDIRTTLENNDERVRYRAVIPTTLAGGTITHEIPFGALVRPEGEYPAQNWMDVSHDGHGLALLNRGLPGNNFVDGYLALSLLKCTALKEGYAEVGGFRIGIPTERGYEKGVTHAFDYALLPHEGTWEDARVYQEGRSFNTPLLVVKCAAHAGKLPSRHSFVATSAPNVVLSALKTGERGTIVRVYEAAGRTVKGAALKLGFAAKSVSETDLVERNPREAGPLRGDTFAFDLGAWEIKTFEIHR